MRLTGNQGETLANESVDALLKIVQQTPAPNGVKAYITGPAPLVADTFTAGNRATFKIMVTTVIVIFIMLLLVYRSVITAIVLLAVVGIELASGPRRNCISGRSRDYQSFNFCHQYPGIPSR